MKALFAILALGTVLFAPAWASDLDDGLAAHKAGEHEAALRLLKPFAQQGYGTHVGYYITRARVCGRTAKSQ